MSTMFPETTATQTSAVPTNSETTVDEVVDLNEEQTIENPDADFNVVPPPPPAKRYPMQVSLHEDGIDGRKSAKVGTFLNIPLVLTIKDGGVYDGYEVRVWINNIYNKLKGTNKAAWLLKCLGVTVPKTIKHSDMKQLLETTLAQNPVCMVDLEWEASYKDETDRRANEQGYVKFKNKMSQFNKLPDGTYSNVLKNPVDGTDIYARVYVPEDAFHAK